LSNTNSECDQEELLNAMETMLYKVSDKIDVSGTELHCAEDNLKSVEKILSKENALLNHAKTTLDSRRIKLQELGGRGVQRIKQIFKAVRTFENAQGFGDTVLGNVEPQELMEHLTKRIEEFTTDDDQPESITRTIKKLRKLSKVKDESGQVVDVVCPCCSRSMEPNVLKVFDDNMNNFADPANSKIVKIDQARSLRSRSAIRNFEAWRTSVSQSLNDFLDYKRILLEIVDAEGTVKEGEMKVKTIKDDLGNAKEIFIELKNEYTEVQELHELARRLRDDASKIADKKRLILSKQEDLALLVPTARGNNLRTLENSFTAKNEQKDVCMNEISELNKESAEINNGISLTSNQAARAEKLLKDKEDRYAQDQKLATRKRELSDSISKYKEEEKKLQDEVVPIRQEVKTKEYHKMRFRSAAMEEEQKFFDIYNQFNNTIQELTAITKQVDEYYGSNKIQSFEDLENELSYITSQLAEQEESMKEMAPKLLALKTCMIDREGHRRNIQNNIELLDMIESSHVLEEELALLGDKLERLEGYDNALDDFEKISKKIRILESEKSRREGSFETFKIQERELKRKLVTPEYRDIDERHRVKMIENETCVIAVSDLDKYGNALDKALLRYHGMKIDEINKIIKELWTLTYKGEDITNIQLTSDQENGSKATRNYNYRVVMTKGTTELDMRGRCSAGQRVLASIVIRLALAETFCLNCGVMALDEPTTNLDYANKQGLVIALAKIIASRSTQENFQLLIITHDEDFVTMMKNELSTHTQFNMPEQYYQVSREEGGDGCYYSNIHVVDWDDL